KVGDGPDDNSEELHELIREPKIITQLNEEYQVSVKEYTYDISPKWLRIFRRRPIVRDLNKILDCIFYSFRC
ncbi:hypothetical protein ACFL1H_05185, partial [Nanoarchaeota archaeon]